MTKPDQIVISNTKIMMNRINVREIRVSLIGMNESAPKPELVKILLQPCKTVIFDWIGKQEQNFGTFNLNTSFV